MVTAIGPCRNNHVPSGRIAAAAANRDRDDGSAGLDSSLECTQAKWQQTRRSEEGAFGKDHQQLVPAQERRDVFSASQTLRHIVFFDSRILIFPDDGTDQRVAWLDGAWQ